MGDGPTPADVMNECDTSGNGMLDKAEAVACIQAHIPEEHWAEAEAMMDKMWPMVDADGNGEVDEHELSEAMRGGPPKKLAKLMKGDGPTPADVIDHCDTSGNGMLDKAEAFNCMKDHIPEEHLEEAKAMMDEMWPMVDKDGNGEIDEHELSKAMRGGPPKDLAQLMKKGKGGKGKGGKKGGDSDDDMPSPAEIMEECDTNEDGMMDADEAHAMVDEGFAEHGPMSKEDIEHEMEEMEEGDGPKAGKGCGPAALADKKKKKKKAAKEEEELAQKDKKKKKAAKELALRRKKAEKE